MKTRMKKISLLLYHAEKDDMLSRLQDLGILHLEVDEKVVDDKTEELLNKKEKITKAIAELKEIPIPEAKSEVGDLNAMSVAAEVLQLKSKKDELKQVAENLTKEKNQLLPWGQFDWEKIARLNEVGIHLRFYFANKKLFEKAEMGGSGICCNF